MMCPVLFLCGVKCFKEFNDISSLAKADEKQVLKLWQGLGYYSRARNLHKTAQHITNNLGAKFPDNYNDLIQLKGVGDYTASAIASICFKESTAVVDGNVYRVLSRYFGISIPIDSTKGIKEFKKLAQLLIDPDKPGTHNQAIMEFGALICKPKNPDCENCLLNHNCYALQNNKTKSLPIKKNKIKIKKRYFNYLILNYSNTSTLILQRNGKDIWQNLFEFPLHESSKEIDLNELLETKLIKDILPDKSCRISKFNTDQIIHKLTHQHLYTTFWIVETNVEIINAVSWDKLTNFAFPTLIQNFVDKYRIRD